ncbi:MAG: outer membrane beta-barrel protein [Bacteroidota bacterium]
MKKLLLIILSVCLAYCTWSQGILKGKIVDSASSRPLGYATITVFKAADTSIITYRLSTPDGDFKVSGIPLNMNCRAVISFSGYGVYRKEFITSASQTTVDIGTVHLATDAKSLDEVLLIAERPPVTVRQDTIEFNASSFKTLPNALVEDLLKKLPGVLVDNDGNITVNGKPVNRIMVDGKVFFGDDPKMATRNLPANVIDKVQVTDDKEELARNGDDNLNNVGKVVNITLKKGVKKGWFGKQYAGGGTDNRYEAGGIANIYRDTVQLSVLGYINNLNRAGFSYGELISSGGFDRVRSNSSSNSSSNWNNNGGSGISINGINFGGSQGFGGISTSVGAGFNLNLAPNKKKSMYLQYFNGNIQAPRRILTDFDQFRGDTVINNNTILTGDMVTHSNNIGIGGRFKPDSLTNILINANYLVGLQDEDRFNDITGDNNKIGPLSVGHLTQYNDGKLFWYKHSIAITRLSKKKKGRSFNLVHSLDINNRYNDYMSESQVRYFYPSLYDSTYAQLRQERIPRTDAVTTFNYSDPIDKHFSFRMAGRYEINKITNAVDTYNQSVGDKFDVFNALLSNDFRRIGHRVLLGVGVQYKWKDLAITPSLRAFDQHVNNRLVSSKTILRQQQFNFLPTLSVVYKQLNLNFSQDVALPAFNYLNPVTDISNPYFISKGNPGLLSSKRNNLSVNYYFNDPKRSINLGGYVSAQFTNRDVVQSITVNNQGVQTSFPVNANGSKNYSMNWNVNKQYKKKQGVIFMWNTGNWMNINKNTLLYNGTVSWQTTFNYNHWFGAGFNLKDKFEFNVNYSFGKNFTRYTSDYFKKLNVGNHNWNNEIVLRWPKHLIWESQVSYSYNGSIPAGMPKDLIKWNAALNITMLKNEAGVLKLSVNDLLNQNNNIAVFANRNTITTTQSNILGRYFLATFTYNVRAAGVKKKVGGRELFMF